MASAVWSYSAMQFSIQKFFRKRSWELSYQQIMNNPKCHTIGRDIKHFLGLCRTFFTNPDVITKKFIHKISKKWPFPKDETPLQNDPHTSTKESKKILQNSPCDTISCTGNNRSKVQRMVTKSDYAERTIMIPDDHSTCVSIFFSQSMHLAVPISLEY